MSGGLFHPTGAVVDQTGDRVALAPRVFVAVADRPKDAMILPRHRLAAEIVDALHRVDARPHDRQHRPLPVGQVVALKQAKPWRIF